ncbi:MAG TPA: TonB-dependent receptor [Burkholderiaceae bacterium]|nr:TonB-dependent receptor [Burkholderiaceae bacterium]
MIAQKRWGVLRAVVTAGATVVLLLGLPRLACAQSMDLARQVDFDIPAQRLSDALVQYSHQARIQIVVGEDLGLQTSKAVKGRLGVGDALAALLAGSSLHYRVVSATSIAIQRAESTIRPTAPGSSNSAGAGVSSVEPVEAPAATLNSASPAGPQSGDQTDARSGAERPTEQVVVTGTNIRDAADTAAPSIVFTRADIDQSGAGTLAAFLQTLPQNFSNTSETTIASVAGGANADNAVNAAGVNLHGMGNDATLVLVNGHRVAPGNIDGNFVDISMIPLAAVDRVEIITDGASAIYGSDAVGGVVNIIMRKDYDGFETRLRGATVTRGSSHEFQAGQTAGTKWDGGNALISYEYYDRTPLSAADRSFTQDAPLPFKLLPQQLRQSVWGSVNESPSSAVTLFADGSYAHRGTYSDATVVGAFSQHSPASIDQYSGTLGARVEISDSTDLEVSGNYGSSDTRLQAFDAGISGATTDQRTRTKIAAAEAIVRGDLGHLPAGSLRYAVGAQYRHESLDAEDFLARSGFQPERDTFAGFLEVRVPLLGADGRSPAAKRLELSAADREEHYSDFGATNNPSVGLIGRPFDNLKLSGTFGRSFVAPQLSELNPVPFEVAAFNTSLVPGSAPPSGNVDELVVFGGNPSLKAQTARTWTFGAEWSPREASGLRARINYYGIRFTDRITNLQSAGYNVFFALPTASVLGPRIVRLNPPQSLVQQLISTPGFFNFGANSLTDIAALIDARELNLSEVDTQGLDLGASYRSRVAAFDTDTGLDATYIIKLTNRFTVSTPTASTVGTLYNPTRVKARVHEIVARGPWSIAAFINYTNSYTNNVTAGHSVPVSSWTTADLTAAYAFGGREGWAKNLAVSLSVINAADRDPPYAANALGYAINYDGANANPLGRYVSLQLTKGW